MGLSACGYCSSQFYAPPVLVRRGGGKYCSRTCYGLARRAATSAQARVACSNCGKKFHLPASRVIRSKNQFCTLECYRAAHAKKPSRTEPTGAPRGERNGNWKGGRVTLPCALCGSQFETLRGKPGKFCSHDCYSKWRSSRNQPGYYSRSGSSGRREDIGIYVRSRWEANWARYLNWQIAQGLIVSWEYEPDTYEFTTIKRGTRFYTPDFKVFYKDGRIEYDEVKGWMDQQSRTKLDRMARYYPHIVINLIDKARYNAVSRTMRKVIKNWE